MADIDMPSGDCSPSLEKAAPEDNAVGSKTGMSTPQSTITILALLLGMLLVRARTLLCSYGMNAPTLDEY